LIRSEIQELDTLITSLQTATSPIGEIKYLAAVTEQCNSVKQQWLKKLFSSVSEAILVRYVHFHQAGVTALSDRLWRNLSLRSQKSTFTNTVISRLEELINFLKDSFYRYFDKRHPISLARWQTVETDLRAQLLKTLLALRQANIDGSLITAIEHAITLKLQEVNDHSLSFQQADAISIILKKLTDLAAQTKAPGTTTIAQDLHRLNFNSYSFTTWHQEYLSAMIENTAEPEKSAIIGREIGLLESIYTDPDKAYEPDLPGSYEQVLRWLRKMTPILPDQAAGNAKVIPERLPLLYSVPQFAFFVRLCYLEGCFPVQNLSAIFRFFTGHFETKKQPNVSVKSFGRAFYSTDQGTAAIVRDLLQRMINLINKTYFPK
jgi:hypothetical protein